MATRRPSVPKAQFTSGLHNGPEKPDATSASTTPAADSGATPGSGAGAEGSSVPAPPRGKRERQLTSGPNGRSRQDGVIHTAGTSPVPARSFSGRILVLVLTMGVFTILLAPNVHTFMTQRSEIATLKEDITSRQAQQDAYAAELQRWDDPAYIERQARERVSMLMPGETGYWVYGANGTEEVKDSVGAAKSAAAEATTAKKATEVTVEPWVSGLWEAVKNSAKEQVPVTPKEPAAKQPAPAVEPTAPAAP